jgi:hypothetical protein
VHPTGKSTPKNKGYPGKRTGWLGYGYDGWGFSTFSGATVALISQLGYPVSHDGGLMMQRTDSQGFVDASHANNTVWGSRQTGGSSGGPEILNLGVPAADPLGTTYGNAADFNIVVGVTSWGYTDATYKQQGASTFTSSNIGQLLSIYCPSTDHPYACD